MPKLDLIPYGINATLTPEFDFNNIDDNSFVYGNHYHDNNDNLTQFGIGGIQYTILETMGSGTYGTTYKVRCNKDGKIYAIKHIHGELHEKRDLITFAKEAIIQIVLAEESKSQEHGPYVPMLYEIAYNPYKLHGYIRSELMRNTFHNLAAGSTPEANDTIIPDALTQISSILEFFGNRLKFNHRDFKGDNVMYVRPGDTRMYKLIDFGFSCLTWHGLKINGGDYFAASPTCFKNHRDLSQMLYYIVTQFPISNRLHGELVRLLKTNVKSKKCVLSEDCEVHSWKNTYNFLNRGNVDVPRGNPKQVYDAMDAFQYVLPPQPPQIEQKPLVHPIRICPPGKVLNPKTSRCVKENGPIGIKQLEQIAAPSDCPTGKIRNPSTRRCVKLDGWAGKHAMKNLHISENIYKPLEIQKTNCPTGKIRNPSTRRCVKLDGWAGKRVQQLWPALPVSESSNQRLVSEKTKSEEKMFKGTRKFFKNIFKKRKNTRKN